jgi:nicotinic acid phosphoribosyltransferase
MYTESDNEKVMRKYDELYPSIALPKIITDSFDTDCVEQIMKLYEENNK